MLIFGYGIKFKKKSYLGRYFCEKCSGYTNYYLYWQYSYFSIACIPVIRTIKNYYIRCNNCERMKIIGIDEGKEMLRRYENFPTEILVKGAIERIKKWIEEEEVYISKKQLLEEIESICHFNENIDYLENIIDSIYLIKEERKVE